MAQTVPRPVHHVGPVADTAISRLLRVLPDPARSLREGVEKLLGEGGQGGGEASDDTFLLFYPLAPGPLFLFVHSCRRVTIARS